MKPDHSKKECSSEHWIPKPAVDQILSSTTVMDEDQPVPMRDRKPVNKHPTAADSFWSEHQAEHDAREDPPPRCNHVDDHNDACPKLKDELDRRRDTSKPTMICRTTQHLPGGIRCGTQTLVSARDWANPDCIMCSQRRKYARFLSNRNTKYQGICRDCRISKSRRRPPLRRIMRIQSQSHVNAFQDRNVDRPKIAPTSSKTDVRSIAYPDTSREASISSYNSLFSMTHEPMCRK